MFKKYLVTTLTVTALLTACGTSQETNNKSIEKEKTEEVQDSNKNEKQEKDGKSVGKEKKNEEKSPKKKSETKKSDKAVKGEPIGTFTPSSVELNVRQAARLDGYITGTLGIGEIVNGYDIKSGGSGVSNWMYVENDSKRGWVSAAYLTEVKEGELEKDKVTNIENKESITKKSKDVQKDDKVNKKKNVEQEVKKKKVDLSKGITGTYSPNRSYMNFREGPSLNDKVIGTISPGEKVNGYETVEGSGGVIGWLKVEKDGKIGWVSVSYMKKLSSSPKDEKVKVQENKKKDKVSNPKLDDKKDDITKEEISDKGSEETEKPTNKDEIINPDDEKEGFTDESDTPNERPTTPEEPEEDPVTPEVPETEVPEEEPTNPEQPEEEPENPEVELEGSEEDEEAPEEPEAEEPESPEVNPEEPEVESEGNEETDNPTDSKEDEVEPESPKEDEDEAIEEEEEEEEEVTVLFETNVAMYAKGDVDLLEEKNAESKVKHTIGKGYAVHSVKKTEDKNGIVWHKVVAFDDNGEKFGTNEKEGWMKESDLTESKYTNYGHVNSVDLNMIKDQSVEDEIWVHNSAMNAVNKLNNHINKLIEDGANMEKFLKENPINISIVESKSDVNSGLYFRGTNRIEFSFKRGNPHILDRFVFHEFGHHIGYKAAHPKDGNSDFTEFGQFKDLEHYGRDETEVPWSKRNQEIFADTYVEAFIDGFQNRTVAGSFESKEETEAFYEWLIKKINGEETNQEVEEEKDEDITPPVVEEEEKEDKFEIVIEEVDNLLFAKRASNIRSEYNTDSNVLSVVKEGYAVEATKKAVTEKGTWFNIVDHETGIEGWVHFDGFQENTISLNIPDNVTIQHKLTSVGGDKADWKSDGSFSESDKLSGNKEQNTRINNSIVNAVNMLNKHFADAKNKGVDIDKLLREHPLHLRIMDSSELPNMGRYWIYPGVMEIAVKSGSSSITEQLIVHEFAHHIGYKKIHGGDASTPGDYSEFGEYRDLSIVAEGTGRDDWKNNNQEKFAESYSEVFLNGYQNRSATGNFESDEAKNKFFDWMKSKISE